jgi:hypothetical protein
LLSIKTDRKKTNNTKLIAGPNNLRRLQLISLPRIGLSFCGLTPRISINLKANGLLNQSPSKEFSITKRNSRLKSSLEENAVSK